MYDKSGNEIESMIGDTNLFIRQDDCQEEFKSLAEAEIMIAEKQERGKNFGLEALCLIIEYGIKELNLEQFEAKIKCDNIPSIKLFEKIGFKESARSEVFDEITFTLAKDRFTVIENIIMSLSMNKKVIEYIHS